MSSPASFFDFHERLSRRPAPVSQPTTATPFTVTEITQKIDGVLRAGFPATLQVRGEVSNFRPQFSSGISYFTLKDAKSCLDCVMFRNETARLRFKPRDGMELLATGRVSVYGAKGKYQLYVDRLEPLGQGALELAFRQLRLKLEAEGLFAQERKRRIPAYPLRVALVTSANAAALQDVLKVLRRHAWLRLSLFSVPVQGDGAAAKIAAAIGCLGRAGAADVILLARGGGSLEDLWQFNEEAVARAVAESPIPVITGIGHEVDTSIADLVADHHAHTPTEAAQVIVQHWKHAADDLDGLGARLRRELRTVLADARHRLSHVERHEIFQRPLLRIERQRQLLDDRQRQLTGVASGRLRRDERIVQEFASRLQRNRPEALFARFRQRLFDAQERLNRAAVRTTLLSEKINGFENRLRIAFEHDQRRRGDRLDALAARLKSLSPEGILQRGYSLTTHKKSGAIVRDAAQLRPGDRLVTRFGQGEVESVVEDSRQLPLFE